MCGIAGLYYRDGAPPEAPTRARQMIEQLRHRGPDGFGYYDDPHVALAHARLSIIDLATGEQPICNEDGTVWVVLNGEIFNYIELRKDLEQAGHRFRTQSDTEVIVHLYEEHGTRFTQFLNGQFAIALWDRRTRRLLLSRIAPASVRCSMQSRPASSRLPRRSNPSWRFPGSVVRSTCGRSGRFSRCGPRCHR